MTFVSVLTPAQHRPTAGSSQYRGLAALPQLIETWRARRRFRADLENALRDNPHLIPDMGLTTWQARAEVTKHFWES